MILVGCLILRSRERGVYKIGSQERVPSRSGRSKISAAENPVAFVVDTYIHARLDDPGVES